MIITEKVFSRDLTKFLIANNVLDPREIKHQHQWIVEVKVPNGSQPPAIGKNQCAYL